MNPNFLEIGILCSACNQCPPVGYGSIEELVAHEVWGLAARGHRVHLWAPSDSRIYTGDPATDSRIVFHPYGRPALRPQGICGDEADRIKRHELMPRALREASRLSLDALHLHDLRAIEAVADHPDLSLPTMFGTDHWDVTDPRIRPTFDLWGSRPVVAISGTQRALSPHLNWVDTVHNGINTEFYSPLKQRRRRPKFLLWLGRMAPEKGPVLAIRVAMRLGIPLVMAGKIDSYCREFYETEVLPLLNGNPLVKYVGEVSRKRARRLYQLAFALLNPILWEEPFGLTVGEAELCGCPVVATRRGAMSELIADGRSGFLVNPDAEERMIESFAEAVMRCHDLNRAGCRTRGEEFGIDRMVDGYERVLRSLAPARQSQIVRPRHRRVPLFPVMPAPVAVAA